MRTCNLLMTTPPGGSRDTKRVVLGTWVPYRVR